MQNNCHTKKWCKKCAIVLFIFGTTEWKEFTLYAPTSTIDQIFYDFSFLLFISNEMTSTNETDCLYVDKLCLFSLAFLIRSPKNETTDSQNLLLQPIILYDLSELIYATIVIWF